MRKTLGVTVLLAAVAIPWSGLAGAESDGRPLAFRVGLWVDPVSGLVSVQPDTSPGPADSSFAVVSAGCPDCGTGSAALSRTVQVVLQATAEVAAGYGVTDLASTGFTVAEVSQSTGAALAPGQLLTVTVTGEEAPREEGFAVSFSVRDRAQVKSAEPWDLTVLHDFTGAPDGANPRGSVTLSGSTLYGMTYYGGASNEGVVFKIGTAGSGYSLLHTFPVGYGDGTYPEGSLTLSGSTLYGMTSHGGASDDGVLFTMDTSGGSNSVLHHFGGTPSQGSYPLGDLTLYGSTLYGMTNGGGSSYVGDVFAIGTSGSGYTELHSFTGAPNDGKWPYGSLLTDGTNLWGMTGAGGSADNGVLFLLRTNGTNYNVLHHFTGGPGDGAQPHGGLIGYWTTLYGMTNSGGSANYGVVFSDSVGGGGFTLLKQFAGFPADGGGPYGDLTRHGSTLYGMTRGGGSNDWGTVFSIDTEGGGYTVLHAFDGYLGGGGPRGRLIYSGGVLYGVAERCGSSDAGVVFRLQPRGLIFADDFDSGDTSAWSSTSP